jgi:membrane protein required for colicin V production
MDAALAGFDIIALVILFMSGVMALMRGFIREALTVTAFVAAALAALWSRPVFSTIFEAVTGSTLLANFIALAVIFLVVYLAVSFVTRSLKTNVKSGDDVTTIDRSLGFAFGLVRGLVLLGLLVLVFQNAMPGAQPPWLTQARVYPLADTTAHLLSHLAPEDSWAANATSEDEESELNDDPIGQLIEASEP